MQNRRLCTAESENFEIIVTGLVEFLKLFLAPTYANRAVGYLLTSLGMTPRRVSQLLGVTDRTVRNWRKQALQVTNAAGLGNLLVRPCVDLGYKAMSVADQIFAELEKANYQTRRQIADMIAEKFGLQLSVSSVGRLLHRGGYTKRRTGSMPAKADPVIQRRFWDETLKPLLKAAKDGKARLFFMDASHFVMGGDFLGSVWCRSRRFVKTFSGRFRYNVLGAVDYVTGVLHTVTNDTYITATQVCELLRKLAEDRDATHKKPVSVVLDNARYQRCTLVQDLAKELNIELVYLPTYSPNLNLIERIWKLVKGELRVRFYDSFLAFRERIDAIIHDLPGSYNERVRSLLGEAHIEDSLRQISIDTYEQTVSGQEAA